MNQRQRALALIACAVALAVAAYIVLIDAPPEQAVHTETAAQPEPEPTQAPEWTAQGQTPEPDYGPSQTMAVNATPLPPAEPEPTVIEVREDAVVTFTFVESLADFFLHRFIPEGSNGKPVTLVTPVSLNMHYGRELDGFAVRGDDIRRSRKTVLDYAFTPTMLESLSALYTPVFMAHLTQTAMEDERQYGPDDAKVNRPLTAAETRDMLRLNAAVIDRTANVFRAMGRDASISAEAGKYLQAQRAVERANAQLQNVVAENKDAAQAGQRLKQAILERERVKAAVVAKLKTGCPACSDATLFYLGQWAYRRSLDAPDDGRQIFETAADVLDGLAEKFREATQTLQ